MKIEQTAPLFAETIGIPLSDWPGNCHAIAWAIRKSSLVPDDSRVERGHFDGPLSKKSIFYRRPIVPHTWLRLPGDVILDPLFWEFQGLRPVIAYIAPDEVLASWYDPGGNNFRMANMTPAPAFQKKDSLFCLDNMSAESRIFTLAIVGNDPHQHHISVGQAFWLANLPISASTPYTKAIYEMLIENNGRALIPLDNLSIVMNLDTP